MRDALVVKLDGVTVWNRAAPFYPSSSQDIVVGHNLIGFSSCERDYGGIILSVGHADSEDEPLTLGVPSTGR